ncbi:glycoside hydrolase domain-containing protein (plasmid) [Lactococcus garvieae]|uniref:glycoside hydrolase domain-containing protein n=1 Tax=Lactococcus garvieae TaxID=1363 RepID=UPI00311AC0AC
MADEMVLATQKWLNKTYGHIPEFNQPNEDGLTGWPTIYALIEGLQIELGVAPSDLFPGFGDTTYTLYEQLITPNWNNLSKNVVYLIQGAFWCKGISPGGFDGVQTQALSDAVAALQEDAGFSNTNGVLSAMWAQALFDMSAFVLLDDPRIREMQQYLNANYYNYTGILPTDGIYQRATNTAIIYALQKEVGLDVETANGVFGPTTRDLYVEAYNNNWSNALSMIIQFGLYANMSEYWEVAGVTAPEFTGQLDTPTTEALHLFQDFMRLSPVTDGSPDLRTTWSLMTSNGDPNRNFFGVDTSLQLTQQNIDDLVAFDVNYVGRYLTGTVGVGENEKDKFLTRSEAEKIIKAGLKIIPIYQDNYPHAEYYTRQQGRKDASTAMFTAAKLGIPDQSFIYFAVDFDALDTDIDNWVMPYFQGVQEVLTSSEYEFTYKPAVYGTRNVCTRIHDDVGIERSYVSNMSSGWSGNLGFSQPLSWAFDQFFESSYGSISAIDFVAVSGLDEAVSYLEPSSEIGEGYWIDQTNWDWLKDPFHAGSIKVDGPSWTLFDYPGIMKAEVSVSSEVKGDPNATFILEIESGKLTPSSFEAVTKTLGDDLGVVTANKLNEMSIGIANAQMEVSAAIDLEGLATWRITITFPDADIEEVKVANSIEIEISFDFDSSTPEGNMQLAFNAIKLYCKENALVAEVIGASGLALVISFLPLATIGTSIVEIGAGLLALAKLLMPAFGRKKDED